MFARLSLAAVLTLLPALARAQTVAPNAAVCDGSQIRHAELVRNVGGSLFIGTAAADVVAMLTIPHSPSGAREAPSHFRVVAITAPVAIAGLLIAQRSRPGETFWQNVVARLKVGETRAADVQLCLHRPDASTTSTAEERWTYVTAHPSVLGGSLRTLRLTFRDSVLADVERTEVNDITPGRNGQGLFGGHADPISASVRESRSSTLP